jgi:curved DNA-binding protein CbpA
MAEEGEFDHINIYEELFQVEMTAEASIIQKKYRKLSLTCHPDLFPDDEAKVEKFMKLKRACDLLVDPARRKNYDAKLKAKQTQQKRKAESTEESKKFRDKLDERVNEFKKQKKDEEDMKLRKSEDVVSAREEAMRKINEMSQYRNKPKTPQPVPQSNINKPAQFSNNKPIIIDDDTNNSNTHQHSFTHVPVQHSKDSYASMMQSHNDFEAQILAQMLGNK